jgi:CheY-like chemotaxis protein
VRGVRVLVVDDYPDNADSMALLRLHGHEVETALSGQVALASARARRPEVVLLDIDMPGMSGYEVAARLRGMFHGGVVLIAITAHGLEADRRRCLEVGFDRHVVKPADPEEVQGLLRELAHSL